jgi:Holliday junction resolvase RusA-like endonuclease
MSLVDDAAVPVALAEIGQLWLPFCIARKSEMRLINIPMPPSSNNIYGQYEAYGETRRVKSDGFRRWEKAFSDWCLEHHTALVAARAELSRLRPGQYIEVRAQFDFRRESILTREGKPKRNDTSNRLKVLHDAIAGALRKDDSLFFDGSFSKRVLTERLAPEVCHVELRIVDAPWMLDGPR